jgi:hypothetical protein
MTTKRRLLTRRPKPVITPEMARLFRRGCRLLAQGREDCDEFRDLDRRLNIVLLRKAFHEVSVLDAELDSKMPGYMRHLASGRDWHISVEQRRALQECLMRR